MTSSAILKLHLDIDLKVDCLQVATYRLYAHNALIIEKNTHDLMNMSHTSKQMYYKMCTTVLEGY